MVYTSFPLILYTTRSHSEFIYVIIQPTVECECKERICVCMVPYASFPLIWYAKWPWGRGLRVKYLLQRCCICNSLQFDMQHDHVLNNLTFDHRVRGAGRGDLRPYYLHVAAFVILFNFICNINMFSISWILTFNPTPKVEWGREKVCRQNICCHVSEFENLFNLIWKYSVKF